MLIGVQLVGLLASLALVVFTFSNPDEIEERLQDFAVAKVQAYADKAWDKTSDTLGLDGQADRLRQLREKLGAKADDIKEKRGKIVPAILAVEFSETCVEKCEYWKQKADLVGEVLTAKVGQLRIGQDTIQDFVLGQYYRTVRGLISDLRRFGIVNVVAMALLIGIVLTKEKLDTRLVIFSVAVTAYAAWAAYGYVYQQDWALTILFRDWAAPSYQWGMVIASCVFFDILFLKGRVTRILYDILMQGIGALAQAFSL